MINPPRRSLYELFVLPFLTLLQNGIDLCTRAARRFHPTPFARPQLLRWERDDDFATQVRHLGLLFACTCLFAGVPVRAQQTPPYFPGGSSRTDSPSDKHRPQERNGRTNPTQLPPDTTAPAHTKLSTAEAEQQIQNKLDDEPLLKGLSLLVKVNEKSVTLLGTVTSEQQRDAAIRIARSYGGERKIVDELTLMGVK